MPIEVNAARAGIDTLRFGIHGRSACPTPGRAGIPMRPCFQLRRDNAQGTLHNPVGCQTHLKWGERACSP